MYAAYHDYKPNEKVKWPTVVNMIYKILLFFILLGTVYVSPVKNVGAANTIRSDGALSRSYFTYKGNKLKVNEIVPLEKGLPVTLGKTTLSDLFKEAMNTVEYHEVNGEKIDNYLYRIGQSLSYQGVVFDNKDRNDNNWFDGTDVVSSIPNGGFYLTLSNSSSSASVKVPFGNAYTVGLDSPAIKASYNQDNVDQTIDVNGMYFQVAANSNFDPLDFIGSNGKQFKLSATNNGKVTVMSNTVDTSKLGSCGTVMVKATNSKEKSSTATFNVVVKPIGIQRLGVGGVASTSWSTIYRIKNGKIDDTDTNIGYDPNRINRGEKLYVGKDTKIFSSSLGGNISYTRISEKSQADADSSNNNNWIFTSDLKNGSVKAVTKKVMHKSMIYNATGAVKYRKIPAFKSITFEANTLNIDGEKYYKLIDVSDYIKAANVDGTKRKLTKNAYVYATSTRRADNVLLKKGQVVTTYGGSFKFKNGKRYYRIKGATKHNGRYVKTSNFK